MLVNRPLFLRQLIARRGTRLGMAKGRAGKQKALPPTYIRGRKFISQLEREAIQPARWHLVVSVDGVPCFSGRYPSERAARAAWLRFKRDRAKESRGKIV